jgi:dTDP-4-amino-4,6-dideoxygalactose transaminase
MNFFRINIFLSAYIYLKSFLPVKIDIDKKISELINNTSNKKYFILTSQLRVGFILLLEYLKKKFEKNEIIFISYNIPEMINVAKNLKLKIKFTNINKKNHFYSIRDLQKKINQKTLAIVITNMFNSYEDTIRVKELCRIKRIILIEDNAIYFDNYIKIKNSKIYSGSIGDYSLYSFNIMKNISALYGGGVSTDDYEFYKYATNRIDSFKNFFNKIYLRQNIIFLLLKFISIKILYKIFFLRLVKYTHVNKNKFLLKIFYPSLRFKIQNFPDYYFSKINNFSKKLTYYQLSNKKKRIENHNRRKMINIYYHKKFNNEKIKEVKLIDIKNFDYQNFLDFPILVKNKYKLHKYLIENGIETKLFHYKDCRNIFIKNKYEKKLYEEEIICLPNHTKINKTYINLIINKIVSFYKIKYQKNDFELT